MKRRCIDTPTRRNERLLIQGTRRGRDRTKKYKKDVIRQDMAHLYVTDDMTLDRRMWRKY